MNDISPFVVTNIDVLVALKNTLFLLVCQRLASHRNTPTALDKKVNGIKINDKYMFNYNSVTAFAIIDNLHF